MLASLRLALGTSRRLVVRWLVDETAPGFAFAVAQHDAGAVGHAGDGVAVGIAECVSDGLIGIGFGRAAPYISKLIAQTQMIAMAEAVEACGASFFLEAEESARNLAVGLLSFKDTSDDHPGQLSIHRGRFRIG